MRYPTRTLVTVVGVMLSGALVPGAALASQPTFNKVSRISHQESGGVTTVTIQGDRTPTFTVYKLERPRRLVVDLANTTVVGYEDPVEVETYAVGLLTVSRFVDSRAVIARVVIGFRRQATYQVKASGSQVVVVITPATLPGTPSAPVAALGDAPAKEIEGLRRDAKRLAAEAAVRKEEADRLAREAEATVRRARTLAGQTRSAALAEADRQRQAARGAQEQAEALKLRAQAQLQAAERASAQTRQAALAYAGRLKAEAEGLRAQAESQKQAAARAAEEARTALRAAESQADATRVRALQGARMLQENAARLQATAEASLRAAREREAQVQGLLAQARRRLQDAQAEAEATRTRAREQAAALKEAAEARASVTWQEALKKAQALEAATRREAEIAQAEALKKAQALEAAARRRAADYLKVAKGRLSQAQEEASRLASEAQAARQVLESASSQVQSARAAAAAANEQAEAARSQAESARKAAALLVAQARKQERAVKRSTAQLTREAKAEAEQARARARAAEAAARHLEGLSKQARVRQAEAVRQALGAKAQAAKAQAQAQQAERALQGAEAARVAALSEVTRLRSEAARYRHIVGRVRQEVASLRHVREEMKGELARLRQEAGAAQAALRQARKQATMAQGEAALYGRLAQRQKQMAAEIETVRAQLAAARLGLRQATDSRRQEEARQALARAARQQAELQLRQLGLAKERVEASKRLLEGQVDALAARHRAERAAQGLAEKRRVALENAEREARERKAEAERLAHRERERAEALSQARRRLESLNAELREAVLVQERRTQELQAALARLEGLRRTETAAAHVAAKRLERRVADLRQREAREAKRLGGMRAAVGLAEKETSQLDGSAREAQRAAQAARQQREEALIAARTAQKELTAARAALAAEREALEKTRVERATLASAVTKAEQELSGARREVAALERSRASQEQALTQVQKRLQREQEALGRVRSRMEDVLLRSSKEKAQAEGRLAALKGQVERMKAQAREAQVARDQARRELEETRQAVAQRRQQVSVTLEQEEKAAARLKAQLEEVRQKEKAAAARLQAQIEEARQREAALDRRLEAKKRLSQREAKRLEADLKVRRAALRAKLEAERRAVQERIGALKARAEAVRKAQAAAERVAASKRRPRSAPSARPLAQVSQVQFVDGVWAHRVVVDVKGPISHTLARTGRQSLTVSLARASIPRNLERSLDVSEIDGPVRLVSSLRSPSAPGSVDLVVDLRREAKVRLSTAPGKLYIDVWKDPAEVARAKTRRGEPVNPPARVVDVAAARVAAYSAPVGPAAAPSSQPLKAYRGYRYGLGGRYTGPRVDMDFNNADIHNVLRLIGRVWNKNIVVAGKVDGKVTIRLQRVEVDRALEVVLKTLQLGMVWHAPNLIRVSPESDIQAELAAIAAAQEKERTVAPVYTRVIPVNFAKAKDISDRIEKNMLSKRGKVSFDDRTNTIIVRDVSANLRAILALTKALDTATPQVMVEARIVEAFDNFTQEIGIQWGGNVLAGSQTGYPTGLLFPSTVGLQGGTVDADTNVSGLQGAGTTNPGYAVNLPAAVGSGSGGALGLTLGSVTGAFNINLRLSALEATGQVRIVSSPKVTVLDNVEAKIEQGFKIPYSQVSAQGTTTIFQDAKLSLKVKPHVTNDGNVIMKIEVANSRPSTVVTGSRGEASILEKLANTEMMIKDGDTAVIGGIFTRSTEVAYSKVPWFAEIPVIGWLFKKRTKKDERSEMLIFITPRIVTPRSSNILKDEEVQR